MSDQFRRPDIGAYINTRIAFKEVGPQPPAPAGTVYTRDTWLNKNIPISFSHQLAPTTTIPMMGHGTSEDIGKHVDLEEKLQLGDQTRVPKGVLPVNPNILQAEYRGSFVPGFSLALPFNDALDTQYTRMMIHDGDYSA